MAYYECCICSKSLNTENPRTFYCSECYRLYYSDIIGKAEWVTFLQRNESQRRRWDTYYHRGKRVTVQLVYLGNEWDISADGKLIPLEEHYE
jgi:hypothetical protein